MSSSGSNIQAPGGSTSQVMTQGNLNTLFQQGQQSGTLTPQQSGLLAGAMTGAMTLGASGVSVDDLPSTSVTLLAILLDDSISVSDDAPEVRDGYNSMLAEIEASKEADNFLISCWKFGSRIDVVHGPQPVTQCQKLDAQNYNPNQGSTNIYGCWVEAFGASMAYFQQLLQNGSADKLIVILLTDGENNVNRHSAQECALLNKVPSAMMERYIPAFIGVGPNEQYFKGTAQSMGIPDGNVLTASRQKGAFRKVFRAASKSAIRASATQIQPGQANNSFFF